MVYDACYGLATVVASQVRKLLIKNGVQVGEVLLVAQDRLLKLVSGERQCTPGHELKIRHVLVERFCLPRETA